MKTRTPNKTLAQKRALRQRAESVKTPITRRGLLCGLSAGALTLALPVWRRLEAQSQPGNVAKRFFGIFTPNGTVRDQFFAGASDSPTASRILAPLSPFASKLSVLRGVHMDSVNGDNKPGGPHMKGPAGMFSGGWLLEGSFTGAGGPAGYCNRITVDQEIANRIGNASAFKSLEYGVDMRGQEPLRYISYRGPNQPNPAVDDPWTIYDRVFSNFMADDSSEAQQRALEAKAVLDYAKGEMGTLRSRLPGEDRPRLEAHMDHLRAIEKQLTLIAPGQCESPNLGSPISTSDDDNYPTIGKLQTDLMFQAQACDLTRVSTFMWSNADSWQRMPWLGIDEEHHELSHNKDDASIEKLLKINTWYSEQIAYFLGLLESVATPNGGTMLDESVVLCGNEIGQGQNHTHEDIPWILAGSGNGHFRTGSVQQFNGEPHNNLLLSVLHAFGMEDAQSFGAPEHCTGPLTALRA